MQRRTAVGVSTAAVLCGLGVASGVPLLIPDDSETFRPIGTGEATRLAESPAPGSTTERPSPPSSPLPRRSTPVPGSAGHGPPVRVTVQGVGISAPVVPVGIDRTGDVAIPEQVDTVGWYRWGPAPGAKSGSVVLVGHVDSAEQGEGAFFDLHGVAAGARITVTMRDHHRFVYRTVAREEFPKSSVPLDALFARTGAPRLTLITCGGSFDSAARSYRDNIVVTAVPT